MPSRAATGDVSIEADVQRTMAAALETFGKLDIMWANAGVISKGGRTSAFGGEFIELEDYTLEDWQEVLAST